MNLLQAQNANSKLDALKHMTKQLNSQVNGIIFLVNENLRHNFVQNNHKNENTLINDHLLAVFVPCHHDVFEAWPELLVAKLVVFQRVAPCLADLNNEQRGRNLEYLGSNC